MAPLAPRGRDAIPRLDAGPPGSGPRSVAVIGGGWAGLAAAVEATRRGDRVTVFEMAPQWGGRARAVAAAGQTLDNGQHILIGAYTQTLELLRSVGVDLDAALLRMPLRVTDPQGVGLQLRDGAPLPAFAGAVLRQRGWPLGARLALLAHATRWALAGFRCDATLTVAALTRTLPRAVRDELIDPLCIAALNTPAAEASARIFLRVLKDALFSGPGSADLLLPRVDLSALWPAPAARWLAAAGATLRLQHRVQALESAIGGGWSVDGERFDRVVLATTPPEAARLTREVAPAWSATAAALRYEPIVTVYLQAAAETRLPEPMHALHEGPEAPAQFVFDRGQLGGPPGLLAFVISGAQPWVDRGLAATTQATLAQARIALAAQLRGPLIAMQTLTEKRATFRCTPNLARASLVIAPGLHAAGDHVDGPYPATLEGAMRSGVDAVRAFG